jgi:ankyrin repeat protein
MSTVAGDAQTAGAKIRQFVFDDDHVGLAECLRAWVKQKHGTKGPQFYLGDVLNVPDGDGWRPLHHAFHLRRYECAKILIDAGERVGYWYLLSFFKM